MADAYLNVAEQVLLDARRPLRPRDIMNSAYLNQLLPIHLHGATQHKTLHARLSEDVAELKEASRFYRTHPGVFFLRVLQNDPATPDVFRHEYLALPRRQEPSRERVLTLGRSAKDWGSGLSQVVSIDCLNSELSHGRYRFEAPVENSRNHDGVAVHSFVLVFKEGSVLSYQCGRYFPDTAPLKGKRSIGLGGAVYATDLDMLFESMFGIIASGIKELAQGIGLDKDLSEQARYEGFVVPCLAVLAQNLEQHRPVMHVVLAYKCPPDFCPSPAALSINDLRWIDVRHAPHSLEGFDQTTKLLFSDGWVKSCEEMVSAYAVPP